MESELLSLQHKKEFAASARGAEIESGEINMTTDVAAFPQETIEKRTNYVDSLSKSSFHRLPHIKAEPISRDHEQFMVPPALPTTAATSHVTQDIDRLNRMPAPKSYPVSQPRMPSTQLPFSQHTPVNLPYTLS